MFAWLIDFGVRAPKGGSVQGPGPRSLGLPGSVSLLDWIYSQPSHLQSIYLQSYYAGGPIPKAFAQAYGLSTSAPAQGGYGGWFDGWKGFLVNFASWWGGYAVGKAVSALALGTAADAGRSALLSPVAAAEAAIDTGLASGFAAASGSVSAGLTAYGWIYGVDTSAWASFFGGVGSAAFSSARDFAQGLPESIFPTAKELAKAASTVADVIRPITPALAGFADVIATGATMVVQNAAWNLSPVARDMTLEFFLNARGFDL